MRRPPSASFAAIGAWIGRTGRQARRPPEFMTKAFEKQDVTEMTEKTAVTHAVVGEDHAGSRLDRFLTRQYPGLPRTRLYRIVRKGEVRVNGKRAEIDTRLVLGDSVRLPPVRATAAEPVHGEPGAASSAPAAPCEVGAAPAAPSAQAAPAAEAPAEETAKADRMVCKSIAPTGSRIAKKTCRTQSQWEEMARSGREATEMVKLRGAQSVAPAN